jgi:hypothetical protein
LIVGGHDEDVLERNRRALARLRCPKQLVIVPGATHLFPEPGALEDVARLAAEWFLRYLSPGVPAALDAFETAWASTEGELGQRFPRADMDPEC